MYCWKCGATAEDVASFCSNCGANLRKIPEAQEVTSPTISAARERTLAETVPTSRPSQTGPSGVGGWLAWFAFSLSVLAPLRTIGILADIIARVPSGRAVVAVEIGFAALGMYALITGILIFAKRPNAIYDAKTFLIVALCANGATAIVALVSTAIYEALVLLIWSFAYFAIWWKYLSKSVRVKNTFPRSD